MTARILIASLLCLLLVACAPQREQAAPIQPPASTSAATTPVDDADAIAVNETPTAIAEAITGEGKAKPNAAGRVDYSCQVDADCAVKNVGNCCGYYPACVNVDSPTFPEQVKAECAASGKSGVCGFPSISACQCVEGRCAAVNGPGLVTDSMK